MGKAIAYLRVSTQQQHRSGLGIEAQRTAVGRFAEVEGIAIIREFVEAARHIRATDRAPRFVLAGEPDLGNPSAVGMDQIEAWSREGAVEWWGQQEDMPEVLRQASIVVLPTVYGEGVPKILLEAAAAGRPIVATDVRGCREIVRPDVNGLLVPPGDVASLVQAIEQLLGKKVIRVNTCQYAGKKKRERRADFGRRPHWKKAIVTLAEGEKIDLA